jgi:Protein of unknown function (DUF3800)
VYLLYLDESGTHAGSPVFVLAGLALHEHDAWYLQRSLTAVLQAKLPPGFHERDFELHAAEIKEPRRLRLRKRKKPKPPSPWEKIGAATRFSILRETYKNISEFPCQDATYPPAAFGAVVERGYADREERAYEEVLHRFDEMLTRQASALGVRQRGIVIHDKRNVERDIQGWAEKWRRVAGRIGILHYLSDVPFFADSKATRLLQAADFVSWAVWRYFGLSSVDAEWITPLWHHFDGSDGQMHGLVHVHPGFAAGGCGCPPCTSRERTAAHAAATTAGP